MCSLSCVSCSSSSFSSTSSPSYKSFLPKDMRAQIQECNFLTRKRIRFRFKRFIQQFSQCCTTARDLKLKYLLSMESLEKSFYTETFQVREASRGPLVILVAADSGVQWCQETFKDSDEVGGVVAQWVAPWLSGWRGVFPPSC